MVGRCEPLITEDTSQYEWLVVRVVWNSIRMADLEQVAHFADRRHGARPDGRPNV